MSLIGEKLRRFGKEFKRRRVAKVTVAYLGGSWLLIEVSSQVFPLFMLPDWAPRLVVICAIIGLPIVFMVSWIFDFTRKGVVRTAKLPRPRTSPQLRPDQTVGLETVLQELSSSFESVQTDGGQFLGIVGEPGMGKSTVCEVFLSQLSEKESECLVGSGKSSERHGETSAFMPVIDALSELVTNDETGEIARDLAKFAPTWYGLVFVGHDKDEDDDVRGLRANSQGRMQHELATLLSQVCARQPIVIYFDDFHWADVSTLDAIIYLTDRLQELSLLLIVSYRESELQQTEHPFLHARLSLQSRNQFHEIKLQAWSQQQIESLMASEFPDNHFPDELFTRIFGRTAGHPLFVVELIRYLKDTDTIKQENDSWVLTKRIDDITDGLPDSVRNMVERKMSRISEGDRRLLSAASVQGQYFDSAVLARVLESDAAQIEEELHQLEHTNALVKLVEEQEMPDRTLSSHYSFGHIMYYDYFLSNLRPSRKVTWARSTADALSAFYQQRSSTVAAELAHLFAAAREPMKAAAHYLDAALNSNSIFAYRESQAMARSGLAELVSAPESMDRDRQELLLQLALGRSLCMTEGYGSHETMVCFARAHELTKSMADGEENLDLVWSLWMAYTNTGNCSMSLELSDRLQAMVTDVLAGSAANLATGFANEMMGNLSQARQCFQKVIDVPLDDGGPERASRFVADPLILARGNQLRILALMGLPKESNDRWKKNLALANSSSLDPRSTAGLLIEGAWYHAFYHRFDETLKLTERTIDICTKYDFFMENQWATFLQSWANTQVGDAKKGLAGIEAFIAFIDATGVLMHAPLYYAIYSDILFEGGHTEKAATWVSRGLEVIEHTGQNYFASEIYRLQGLIAASRQQNDLSLSTLKKAHQIARKQDARLLELRAAMSLSSILASTGAEDEGIRILNETTGRMHDGFQSKELQDASFILKARI